MLGSSLHHHTTHTGTPCENDLIYITALHQRFARFPKPSHSLHYIRIKPINNQGGAHNPAKVIGTPRRVFRNFRNYGVAREQTRNDVVEKVMKGVVPWCNHSKDAKGDVFDICCLVKHHWTGGAILFAQPDFTVRVHASNLLTSSHNFSQKRIDLGFTRIPRTNTTNILHVINDISLNCPHHPPPFSIASLGPFDLRFFSSGAHVVYFRGRHGFDFSEFLECRRIETLDEIRAGGIS
mmetsp:Transcript_12643/g.15946  ORF Transcript_12643/g.15946 Transcript_12643/m.15946 type:complete len:237 (+) Transcript_12643:918-1628(+)